MYIIAQNNKVAPVLYSTYEQARQTVRKMLRKAIPFRHKGQPDYPMAYSPYQILKVQDDPSTN